MRVYTFFTAVHILIVLKKITDQLKLFIKVFSQIYCLIDGFIEIQCMLNCFNLFLMHLLLLLALQ